jgi:hypothetical protein
MKMFKYVLRRVPHIVRPEIVCHARVPKLHLDVREMCDRCFERRLRLHMRFVVDQGFDGLERFTAERHRVDGGIVILLRYISLDGTSGICGRHVL